MAFGVFRRCEMRIFLLIILMISLPACSYDHSRYADPDDGSENVVYQFIDAETMKPIQGAYVNAVWVKPTPAGKVGSPGCVRAALLRSDANGWVRMKGPKGAVLDRNDFMVPEYEFFTYSYKFPDENYVTHNIRADSAKLYPAWTKRLEQLGYVFGMTQHPYYVYYKKFPIKGFVDNVGYIKYPQRYFIKYRSFPDDTNYNITNVANSCGSEGENIGLSDLERAETGTRRGLLRAQILCDQKWDTSTGGMGNALSTSFWLIESPKNESIVREKFSALLPDYPKILSAQWGRPFTKSERLTYCAWIEPYVRHYQ
jgi:hypothetical protein